MNSRRTFLAGLGAAALAPKALSAAPPGNAAYDPPGNGEYVIGVTSNPQLPGSAGELVLKTWLSVDANGTGFGILADSYDAGFGSHLTLQSAMRHGNNYTWQGVVARSNEPGLVGQPFSLSAQVEAGKAALQLVLMGQVFSGQGRVTN